MAALTRNYLKAWFDRIDARPATQKAASFPNPFQHSSVKGMKPPPKQKTLLVFRPEAVILPYPNNTLLQENSAMKNVFIINAHEAYLFSGGKLNATLVEKAKINLTQKGYDVRITTMKDDYAVEQELKKHQWADAVVLQSPVNWMEVPMTVFSTFLPRSEYTLIGITLGMLFYVYSNFRWTLTEDFSEFLAESEHASQSTPA